MCFIHFLSLLLCFFFFNDTPTTEIYTLSLHDALPILGSKSTPSKPALVSFARYSSSSSAPEEDEYRSEEHTSELQSLRHLVCRLLLEKKKKIKNKKKLNNYKNYLTL